MTTFTITVDSPYVGVNRPHYEGELITPLSGQLADELGKHPTAEQIAHHFAAEYCDSGSVIVEGDGERGRVLRRSLPG